MYGMYFRKGVYGSCRRVIILCFLNEHCINVAKTSLYIRNKLFYDTGNTIIRVWIPVILHSVSRCIAFRYRMHSV